MAATLDFLETYRDAEAHLDPTEQTWYIAAVSFRDIICMLWLLRINQTAALAGANAGVHQRELYRMAIKDLPLEKEMIVQRRLKEALTKISILIGNPRALGSLIPMFQEFKPDGIDMFAPR
jgi:hypothetical protein